MPFAVEVFAHKPPMTMMRCGFGAQQASTIEHLGLEAVLDLPLRQQGQETAFINVPVPFLLLVRLQHRVGWCQ